jgi:hypothetical protein
MDPALFLSAASAFLQSSAYGWAEDAEGGMVSGSERGVYRFYRGRLEHLVDGLVIDEIVVPAPGVFLVTATPNPETQASVCQTEPLTAWKIGTTLTVDKNGTVLATCPGGYASSR